MSKYGIMGATALFFAGCATAPTPPTSSANAAAEAEVLDYLDSFFTAFAEKDEAALRSQLMPNGVIRTLSTDALGQTVATERGLSEWAATALNPAVDLLELYWDPAVNVDRGSLATAWTPYTLDVNGDFSNCGVNHFTLVNLGEGWRVQEITFTADTDEGNCDAFEQTRVGPLRPSGLAGAQ